MHQLTKHRQAKATIARIFQHPELALVIHYSCESFVDRPEGRSPRVTSIAVRNLATGLTESFSIHQFAERDHLTPQTIPANYDSLERKMLAAFYDFAARHAGHTWLHWNMRDINYGFPALAHRFRVLGGNAQTVQDDKLVDVSRLLVSLFGLRYMNHPRLENLLKLNDITMLSFMSGKDEAEAFDQQSYVKLHQSTLRKVDNLANVVDRVAAGTLKTYATWRDRYGVSTKEAIIAFQSNWIVVTALSLLALVGVAASLLGVSLKDCRASHAVSTPVSSASAH